MDLMIGFPMGKTISSKFFAHAISFLSMKPVLVQVSIQNDVSIGRNILFSKAREKKMPIIMIDSDVIPELNPKIFDFIDEDFASGYDVVVAPLLSHSGNVLFYPKDKEDLKKTEPYEIVASGFGFVAFSQKIVTEIPPLSNEHTKTISDIEVETFFWKTPAYTEDYVFCNYATKNGYKICADPRIKASHLSEIPLEFNPLQVE